MKDFDTTRELNDLELEQVNSGKGGFGFGGFGGGFGGGWGGGWGRRWGRGWW